MDGSAMTAVPKPRYWLAGEGMIADKANEITDLINFLRNPPTVHVRRQNSTFTFTGNSGTWAKLTFDTLVNSYDPYGMWDSGATDRITIQVPGWYSCEMTTGWAGTTQDVRFLQGIYKNGTSLADDMILRYDQRSLPNNTTNIRRASTLFLNEGDFLHLLVYTEGTGTFTISANSAAEAAALHVRWVSS
jgi:hypothetical protein